VSALAPVQAVLERGGRLLGSSLNLFGSRGRMADENRRLRERIQQVTEERDAWRRRATDAEHRLESMAEFREHAGRLGPDRPVAVGEGEVIGQGTGPLREVVFINRGSRHRIRHGMAVAAGRSIVGKVRAVGPVASSVRLVTSPASRLDGRVTSTGERGIVVGNGDGTMRMEYISKKKPRKGGTVVTTGLDGITPRHFVLGWITHVERRPAALTYEVTLQPLRDLDQLVGVTAVRPVIPAADFPVAERNGADEDG